jgi:ABC-type branched-subunit amino acid transport system substrate-binding protein
MYRNVRRTLGIGALFYSIILPITPATAQVNGVTADKIVLGQTSALSGPFGDLGQEMLKGSRAYFASINSQGGVFGRKVELVTKDDAYDAARAVANVKQFIEDKNTFCLFNSLGTPATEAILSTAKATGIPLIAPFTGAKSVRDEGSSAVLNIRAGYSDEAAHLVRHLNTIGIKKIALVYQNNSFGREILNSVERSLAESGLGLSAQGSIESSGVNAATVTANALAAQPEALLIGLAGKSSLEVIRAARALKPGLSLYAISVVSTPANLRELGPAGRGVVISQVVPFPTSTLPLAREYRDAMLRAGYNEFTHLSFEGYINAKVTSVGLARAGRSLSTQSFISALQSIQRLDLGGLEVSFGRGGASGLKFVELTMIDRSGALIK